MSARRGSPRIERLPSARGPHSMRPWNQPITLPSAIACAVCRQSVASSAMRSMLQPAASKSARRCGDQRSRSRPASPTAPSRRGPSRSDAWPSRRRSCARSRRPRRSRRRHRRRRLDVELLEGRTLQHLAVGHRVEGAAAGQHDGIGAVARVQRVQQVEEGLLVGRPAPSARCRDACPPAAPPDRAPGRAASRAHRSTGGRPRGCRPSLVVGALARGMAEVAQVEREAAVVLEPHDLAHLLDEGAARRRARGP